LKTENRNALLVFLGFAAIFALFVLIPKYVLVTPKPKVVTVKRVRQPKINKYTISDEEAATMWKIFKK